MDVAIGLSEILVSQDFKSLPISIVHAQKAGLLGGVHRDPFDRMLVAQSIEERLTILTNESVFDSYGVMRVGD